MAEAWQQLSSSERSGYLKEYNDAGISVIVSAFGETDAPTSSGTDAVTVANNLASWVRKHDLQGVDIDYEVCFNSLFVIRLQIDEVSLGLGFRCIRWQVRIR